jgi:ribonucleoside-diphosphate reductase alpha chain/ribonucleoside-triphosphate reductase
MNLYTQDENDNWVVDKDILHRMMSNNSTAYWGKPSKEELKQRFEIIKHSAENNFFNMESARKRKPNVKGTNPLTL